MSNNSPFARRTNWPLSSNQLSSTLNKFRENNVSVLDLTESNPTRCDFQYPNDKILRPLAEAGNLEYKPTPQGTLEAREAISQYYKKKNFDISPSQIFLTSSTSEAYSYLFRLLVNEQQQVLFPQPSYPLFQFLSDLNDVHMETYPLLYEDGWKIDLIRLQESIGPDTKAVVLVNPNNPTGSFVKKEEVMAINAICKEHNMPLICDEVFWDFAFKESKDHVSLVENDQVLTFVLGGISKTLGLPQMKLSWIIINGPQELVEASQARCEVISDTYLSVNTPSQNAFARWLCLAEEIQKEIMMRIEQNLTFLKREAKSSLCCRLLKVEGGWYAVLAIPDTYSEEQWVLELLTKDHVFVHPGYFFDFEKESYIILSLLPPADIFQEGVNHIFKRIESTNISQQIPSLD